MDMSMGVTTTMSMTMSSGMSSTTMAMSTSSMINLPLSDPNCNSTMCTAFAEGHTESQNQISWASQFLYGHWVSITWCIVIGLFTVWFWMNKLIAAGKTSYPKSKTSAYDKLRALIRSWTYRRTPGKASSLFNFSLGTGAIILLSTIFLTVMVFAQHPYYRLHRGYGSPPLGVRAGLMSVALTPLVLALSGKVNIITMLTGISYERLNVLHRYISYLTLYLAVVHTVPFIVQPLIDSKGGPSLLAKQWAYDLEGATEYSGIPALVILVFICVASIPWLRRKAYEMFAYLHWLAAIAYLAAMFWHVAQELDSPRYLWATVGIWAFQVLGRLFLKLKTQNLQGAETTVEELDEKMVRVTVHSNDMAWRPGQHVYLRFPGLAPADNHPFTIASVYKPTFVEDGKGGSTREPLRFLIQRHDGFTKRLARHAQKFDGEGKLRVFLDGPYGGLNEKLEYRYDAVILVAGGSGISVMLPHLVDLSRKMRMDKRCVTKEVRLVWAVKTKRALRWVENDLAQVMETAPEGSVFIEYFITSEQGGAAASIASEEIREAEQLAPEGQEKEMQVHARNHEPGKGKFGRPALATLLPEMVHLPRTCVLACGPEGMNADVSNAVARCQSQVMSGHVEQISLHSEVFGW